MRLVRFVIFRLIILVISFPLVQCSLIEVGGKEKKFREKFEGTVWEVSNELISFSKSKLFYYLLNNGSCYFWEDGSYNNTDLEGCVFNNVLYKILLEDSDNLVVSENATGGNSSRCGDVEVIIDFQFVNETTMELKITRKEGADRDTYSQTATRVYDQFSLTNCSNGALNGFGWD